MRTEQEMLKLVLDTAQKDERVRVVGMNGSRVNPTVPKDRYQDYDVVYVVDDMQSFLKNPTWIDVFGPRIILQMPEAMSMFPPELGNWFSYLMLFEDGTRIDMILVPLEELEKYIQDDKLIVILLDKDGRVGPLNPPSDQDYWVKRPSATFYDDCCNEFWWLSTYVAKGLCRKELPYAIDHLAMMRGFLLMMLSWQVGVKTKFSLSVGKNYKYLDRFLPPELWGRVMETYRNDAEESIWAALWLCCSLFRQAGQTVGGLLGYSYPEYDSKVTPYLEKLCGEQGGTENGR